MPVVSVILPVFNAERYLSTSISSLLRQTLHDIEVIIVDDGSTDQSPDIIQGFAETDPRVRAFWQPNSGISVALNHALGKSRAKLIARMDADDFSQTTRLARQIAILERKRLDVIGCWIEHCDDAGLVRGRTRYRTENSNLTKSLADGSPAFNLCHPTLVFRREKLESIGGYSTKYRHAEDTDLYCRLAEAGSKFGNVSEFLYIYRNSNQSVSRLYRAEQHAAASLAILSHWSRMTTGFDPINRLDAVDDKVPWSIFAPQIVDRMKSLQSLRELSQSHDTNVHEDHFAKLLELHIAKYGATSDLVPLIIRCVKRTKRTAFRRRFRLAVLAIKIDFLGVASMAHRSLLQSLDRVRIRQQGSVPSSGGLP